MKTGDSVTATYRGEKLRVNVLLASSNGKSLMLGMEDGLFRTQNGLINMLPVSLHDDGTYRELLNDLPIVFE